MDALLLLGRRLSTVGSAIFLGVYCVEACMAGGSCPSHLSVFLLTTLLQVLNKDITRVLTTILMATTVCTIYNAALFTNLAIQVQLLFVGCVCLGVVGERSLNMGIFRIFRQLCG